MRKGSRWYAAKRKWKSGADAFVQAMRPYAVPDHCHAYCPKVAHVVVVKLEIDQRRPTQLRLDERAVPPRNKRRLGAPFEQRSLDPPGAKNWRSTPASRGVVAWTFFDRHRLPLSVKQRGLTRTRQTTSEARFRANASCKTPSSFLFFLLLWLFRLLLPTLYFLLPLF